MELDKFEYEIRDVVLEAFGKQDSLTRQYLLELFDDDEPMAAAIVAVLQADGLVAEVGLSEQYYLPVLLVRKPAALAFLQNGGYTRQFEIIQEKKQLAKEKEGTLFQDSSLFSIAPEEKEPVIVNDLKPTYTSQPAPAEERYQGEADTNELQKLNAVLQKENRQYRQTLRERNEEIKQLSLKIKQLQYAKLLWWLAGFLLLVIIVLSYKLHVKVHH